MSEQITATLKFSTGMHSDAALISIESNSEQMVSDDIYDCGVYDWIAYNLEIEIPKCSILTIKVDVNASYWGDDIDEINYSIIGDVKIQDTRNHDRMTDEIAELRNGCVGIFDDYSYEEVSLMSPSIIDVWELGRKFKDK